MAADETRAAILEAALEAFSTLGYEGASTRAIAAAAGVTQPLLSYHFAGKAELWRQSVDHLFAQLQEANAARLDGLRGVDDAQVARLMIRHFVEFSAAHPQLHRIITQETKHAGERLDWLVERHVRPMFDAALGLLEGLVPGGRLDPERRAHLYYFLTGAAATVFVLAPECERLTGIDPFAASFVAAHADLVVDTVFTLLTQERSVQRVPA